MDGPIRSGLSSRIDSFVEVSGQPFLGQFHAVAFDSRKADFKFVALRTDGPDLNGLARRLRRCDDRLRRKVEWYAEDVGIFDIEKSFIRPFFIQPIGLTTQRTANDLLAKELRAEGP